ncbi:MAG: formimidoylglutamase [Chloroflexi bacterium]|nr:formimidoylglutamase [Chloroflexota bacterium]
MNIFEHLSPVDEGLRYKRNDPNDLRWGDVMHQQAYEDADIVLLGCPQDMGVERNKGRVGAKDAPAAVRRAFYRLVALPGMAIFDAGDIMIQESLEATHDLHRSIVREMLRDGKQVVVLGGGNDTSYPDCSALSLESKQMLAFNVDAHFDVRADTLRNSGTPYRQLLEEGYIIPENFYEVAYQPFANSPVYVEYLDEMGVTTYSMRDVHERGIDRLFHAIIEAHHSVDAIFWGLDMDVVRAADAPGVSAVNPTGLTGEEFIQIASLAGSDPRSRLFEITEINPTYDIDERTCRLAAVAIYNFILGTT